MILQPIKFADKFLCKSARLKNWNYSTPGIYFITICTLNGNNFFGKIENGKMILSKIGIIAYDCLIAIPAHFSNIKSDELMIMPNHVHLLLNIPNLLSNLVETHDRASLHKKYQNYHFHRLAIRSNQTVPLIISQFKSSVKRQCNQQKLFFAWQSRFYDHIIQNEKELLIVQNYIIDNPINWQKDKYYVN